MADKKKVARKKAPAKKAPVKKPAAKTPDAPKSTEAKTPAKATPKTKAAKGLTRLTAGTIPNGFTLADCCKVADEVGLKVWMKWGYNKKEEALREFKTRAAASGE